jgi:hypothetical protein
VQNTRIHDDRCERIDDEDIETPVMTRTDRASRVLSSVARASFGATDATARVREDAKFVCTLTMAFRSNSSQIAKKCGWLRNSSTLANKGLSVVDDPLCLARKRKMLDRVTSVSFSVPTKD